MSIAENLADAKNRIAEAAKKCGRDPDSIKLIAVSKTKPTAEILEAIKAGQTDFGENYAQELRDKNNELITNHQSLITEVKWHFIGHLQKNKLKYVLPVADWIHTVDSAELIETIGKWSTSTPSPLPLSHQGRGKIVTSNYLIEVNIAGEPSKSGITPENVFSLVETFTNVLTYQPACRQARRTNVLAGLMCMPPILMGGTTRVADNALSPHAPLARTGKARSSLASYDPENSRPYFKKLKSLLDEINSRNIYPQKLTELSMGMSHDFDVAVEEGSTMVRIGTAIFGERW